MIHSTENYIERIGVSLPSKRSILEDAEKLALSPSEATIATRFFGGEFYRKSSETLETMLVRAGQEALGQVDRSSITHLIYAHSLPRDNFSRIDLLDAVARELGLSHSTRFTVGEMGCVAGLFAIFIADQFLRTSGEPSRILVLTGDVVYEDTSRNLPGIGIASDVAAAALISSRADSGYAVLSAYFESDSDFYRGYSMAPEERAIFDRNSPIRVADIIAQGLAVEGSSPASLTYVIPQNVNVLATRRTMARLGLPLSYAYLRGQSLVGHAFCSDVLVNLWLVEQDGCLKGGDKIALASSGMIASYGAIVCERRK